MSKHVCLSKKYRNWIEKKYFFVSKNDTAYHRDPQKPFFKISQKLCQNIDTLRSVWDLKCIDLKCIWTNLDQEQNFVSDFVSYFDFRLY